MTRIEVTATGEDVGWAIVVGASETTAEGAALDAGTEVTSADDAGSEVGAWDETGKEIAVLGSADAGTEVVMGISLVVARREVETGTSEEVGTSDVFATLLGSA